MSLHRFFLADFLPGSEGEVTVPLSAEDLHHAASVLRLRVDEEVELAEPPGGSVWRARVVAVDREALVVEPLARLKSAPECDVVLVQGVAKGDKMDRIVRQAVEIGVSEVVPVITERTIVRLDAAKRAEKGQRWRRVARAAAEQSHRALVPIVRDPVTLLEALPVLASSGTLHVLWEEAESAASEGLDSSGDARSRAAVVVGPEGGLTAAEVEALQGIGGVVVSLGDTILRTETAAVVAVALLVHARGGLGAGGSVT